MKGHTTQTQITLVWCIALLSIELEVHTLLTATGQPLLAGHPNNRTLLCGTILQYSCIGRSHNLHNTCTHTHTHTRLCVLTLLTECKCLVYCSSKVWLRGHHLQYFVIFYCPMYTLLARVMCVALARRDRDGTTQRYTGKRLYGVPFVSKFTSVGQLFFI